MEYLRSQRFVLSMWCDFSGKIETAKKCAFLNTRTEHPFLLQLTWILYIELTNIQNKNRAKLKVSYQWWEEWPSKWTRPDNPELKRKNELN